MPRIWGATRAYVRELDQIPSGVNYSYNGQQYLTNVVPNSPLWNRKLSQIGDGSCRFFPTQNWDRFLVPGRVLVVEQPVTGYGFVARVLTCFLIEDVEPDTNGEIYVRGPGVESLTTRKPRFAPVGQERVYATAIAPQNQTPARTTLAAGAPNGNQSAALTSADGFDINDKLRIRMGSGNDGAWHAATITGKSGNTVNFSPALTGDAAAGNDVQAWPASGGAPAHAPIATTLAQGAPHGMDAATLATTEDVQVGDEIRIRTGVGNAGPWFSATILTVNPPGAPYPDTVQFVPDLTADAPVGNSVEVRAAQLRVYDPRGYAEGQRVEVALDGGGTHETVVVDASSDELTVSIREGLPTTAAVGNAMTAYDYGLPTTADVTQAMQSAADWQVAFETGNGSATGTAFSPKGESVFDILLSIAERTGEFFRYALDASNIPTKRLEWRRTPDWSGVTLIMYDTDERTRQVDHELDATVGSIYSIRQRSSHPLVTRIYPSAGDQSITLASCSEGALLYAAVEGCNVHISDDFYEPDYIEYTPAVVNPKIGVHALRQTYGDISIDDAENAEQLQAACDQLLLSAVQELLQAQLRQYYTVEAFIPMSLKPGQTVKIENATRVTPNVTTANSYIILEATERQVNGRPRTTLTISNMLGLRRTPSNIIGSILRTTTQSLRRVASGGARSSINVAVTGGAVGSHAHTEYLPIAGGVPLVGNMPVADGVTIDSVDISAHAANPAAHHAPVTVTNNGLLLTGQALALRLSASAPGLQIRSTAGQEGLALLLQSPAGLEASASGLALADGIAGEGLRIAAKVLHLDLASPSGLGIFSDRLGMAMADSDLSATTLSAVFATGHKHRIINSSDGQTNPTTLLSSGASGQLRLAGLGIGGVWSSSEALLVQANATTQTVARFKATANQYAPLWRVENSAGQALILLTAAGDLESGNPAFVSRVSGWQLEHDGDAELNNVFIRGELHATTFVADEMHATGGTLAVATAAKVSKGINASDNVLSAVGSTFVLNTQAGWDSGLSYFAVNDVVRWKSMGEIVSGGSLDLYDIYMQVVAVGSLTGRNLANGNAGYYPLTVRRLNGGATGFEIPAGSAAVRWGKIGGVSYTGNMLLTADLPQSPYLDIATIDATQSAATWQSAPVVPIPRLRLGNLDGVLGLPEQWGVAAGTNLSDSTTAARYIVASNLQVRLNNVDLSVYQSAFEVIRLNSGADGSSPSIAVGQPSVPTGPSAGGSGFWAGLAGGVAQVRVGSPTGARLLYDGAALTLSSGATGGQIILNPTTQSIALGSPLPTGTQTGGAGFWVGLLSGSAYGLRIGGALGQGPQLLYDGSTTGLHFRRTDGAAVISLLGTGAAFLAGPLTIGADGGLWQGTGTWDMPGTGIQLRNVGGIGRLATYSGGLIQTAMDTDGAFKAGWDGGAWNVQMNRDGLSMTAGLLSTDEGVITDTRKRLSWKYAGATAGWIAGRYVSANGASGIEIVAGPEVSGAGARFNYKVGAAVPSAIWSTGDLRLMAGNGSKVQAIGGDFEVTGGNIKADGLIEAATSLYAANGIIVGGAPFGANQNVPGVLTLYRRTTHPANPSNNSVAVYLYHNTGTGRYEYTMRNAVGATVKMGEIAAA